ncbi:MAG: imelysin family protein [Leptospiraceae bacterium]|nr:imelysin family protein [Leptospiraceae bacterium]
MNIKLKQIFIFKLSATLSTILLLIYCSRANQNGESRMASINGILHNRLKEFNPLPLLSNVSKNVILKSYSDLEQAANEFNTNAQTYSGDCSNNARSLLNLQSGWKKNASIVKQIEIIQFGPAQFGGFYESIDPWVLNFTDNITPDINGINSFIAGSTAINSANVSTLNKLQKGLPTIEFLLFSDANANTSVSVVCSALTARRLDTMKQLVSLYYISVKELHSQWKESGSNYVNELPTAGLGSIYFSSQQFALTTLLLQFSNHIEFIRDNKLGYPAGLTLRSNGIKRANVIESRFANRSIDNLVDNLVGVNNLYTGINGPGISDYVKSVNPGLDLRIRQQILFCIANLQKITNLETAINSNASEVQTAYNSLTTLKTMLTSEISATFGSTGSGSGSSGDGD